MENIIKSKDRVRNHGEVFTSEKLVNDMLNLIPDNEFKNPLSTFLEPACGNGNFLIRILERKLSHSQGDPQVFALQVLSSMYGIDIQQDNIEECIERLLAVVDREVSVKANKQFLATAKQILIANIQVGNSLDPEGLQITQYFWNDNGTYSSVKILFKDIQG